MRCTFYMEMPHLSVEIETYWPKCLSWNRKYFLSCWVNSTRITWCLYFLETGAKHTNSSSKNRKLAVLFSWRTAQVLCQLEWRWLCCCPEKGHTRTALGQVFTLLSNLDFGWGPLHSSSATALACVCTCELHRMDLPLGCRPSVLSAPWLLTVFCECAGCVKSICGLWEVTGTITWKGPCAVWLRWSLRWFPCSSTEWFSEVAILGLWPLAPPPLFLKRK